MIKKKILAGASLTMVVMGLVMPVMNIAHAQTAPTWNASDTESIVSGLTTSFTTQIKYVFSAVSGYVLPFLVVVSIFGMIFGLLWLARR